jgi:hypothetical protein
MKVIKTLEQIEKEVGEELLTTNANGSRIRIDLIWHFNNTPQISIPIDNYNISPYEISFPPLGSGQATVGYILQGILEVLDKSEEDGVDISTIRDFPMRVLWSKSRIKKVIGFGHFTKDQFVLIDELNKYAFEDIKKWKDKL